MSMYTTIRESASQLSFEPEISNQETLKKTNGYVVVGMGGSSLAAGVIKMWKPELDVITHQDYGLPQLSQGELENRLIICSSYSGNTEEVVDAYTKAGDMGLNRAVITTGGKLLELAKKDKVAYIQMPNRGIQPRAALGLSIMSFLKLLGQEEILTELNELSTNYQPEDVEVLGKELAELLHGKIPVIYTSRTNAILGYIWKINFNETGKVPAFCNCLPELNHNEMNGFGVESTTALLSRNFYFLFLTDGDDLGKIKQRMEITAKLYEDHNLHSHFVALKGSDKYQKFFNAFILAEFTAFFTAINYGLEAEQVPMVEELKKRLS